MGQRVNVLDYLTSIGDHTDFNPIANHSVNKRCCCWIEQRLATPSNADRLYPGGATAHYATVQKLLERLRSKECVDRSPQGRGHVYQARIARSELIASQLRATADKLCEGSLTPLLTHLARSDELSADELSQLRELVERLDEER